MQHYRCKCGEYTSFGSMPPRLCQTCSQCGSTLGQSPSDHPEPVPHEYVTRYEPTTGEPFEMCKACLHRRKDDP